MFSIGFQYYYRFFVCLLFLLRNKCVFMKIGVLRNHPEIIFLSYFEKGSGPPSPPCKRPYIVLYRILNSILLRPGMPPPRVPRDPRDPMGSWESQGMGSLEISDDFSQFMSDHS